MFTSLLPGPAYSVWRASERPFQRQCTTPKVITHAKTTKRRQESDDYGDDADDAAANLPANMSRRDFFMHSMNFAALGASADSLNTTDGRTVVNAILGAYGLPKISGASGFREFDDFDEEYTFLYPTSWVRRKNTLRSGVYIADFQTADKLSVETFPLPQNFTQIDASPEFAQAVVQQLLNPGGEASGLNTRVEVPRAGLIKCEAKQQDDGVLYAYLAFPSSTTTTSGYDVRRKNVAVAAVKNGTVFALGASARSDQWNAEKAQLLENIANSFRIRAGRGVGGGGGSDTVES